MMNTKIELINKIEATGMMLGFDRNLLMQKSMDYLEWAYARCLDCVAYCEKYGIAR